MNISDGKAYAVSQYLLDRVSGHEQESYAIKIPSGKVITTIQSPS